MLKECARFLIRQVIPRWTTLLGGGEFWIAGTLATLFALNLKRNGLWQSSVGAVSTTALAYAAVGFGFSLAGLVLALTLPDATFAQKLATTARSKVAEGGFLSWRSARRRLQLQTNPYSDLLFIFTWTALAHWVMVVVSFAFLIEYGFGAKLIPGHVAISHRVMLGVWAFVSVYAVELFLLTLITLSQVGRVYIGHLRKS
jgi:hypothetical protein